MVKVLSFGQMEILIQENGLKCKSRGLVKTSLPTGILMKDNTSWENNMVKESISGKIKVTTKEISKMEKRMEKEYG